MHWNDLRVTLNIQLSKVPCMQKNISPKAQILVPFALWQDPEKSCWKLEMHQITSRWTWTLNCQKYPVYTDWILISEVHILLYFALWPVIFKIKGLKIIKALNDLRLTLNTSLSKGPCLRWILTHKAKSVISFALTTSWCRDTRFCVLSRGMSYPHCPLRRGGGGGGERNQA